MNNSKLYVLCISLICVSSLHSDPTDLVKTCEDFKKAFVEACDIIGSDSLTDEMKFIYGNIMTGGSIVFYGAIIPAIDDCVKFLSQNTDEHTKTIITMLNSFKSQINSDEMYDLNTGNIYKRETVRSGKIRISQYDYDATKCYRVARQVEIPHFNEAPH